MYLLNQRCWTYYVFIDLSFSALRMLHFAKQIYNYSHLLSSQKQEYTFYINVAVIHSLVITLGQAS